MRADEEINQLTIMVEARVMGQRRPAIEGRRLPLSLASQEFGSAPTLALRALIGLIVADEVESFEQRQQDRRLTQVLSALEIVRGAEVGKITSGGQENDAVSTIDRDGAVATALQAFTDGLYFVFVNDRQYLSLDDHIQLKGESKVQFIRLVALAGGEL